MAEAEARDEWWRNAVVYQVYIRSFADGNDDGIGDVAGLRGRLGYLRDLGVDAIWINPWYPSPLRDGGYDVSDYRDIDPRYGTLAEATALIEEAHAHGIRVIIDFVPNHTSSEHPWFREALAGGPGSAARKRYLFHPGTGPEGSEPPSDWEAVFGGPAWERLPDGDWYLHIFDVTQPDLNWDHPEVRAEFDDLFRFWLDLGVDGIRVDVAHGMVKDTSYPDIGGPTDLLATDVMDDHPHWNRDGVHEINRRWRKIVDEYDDRMMVAEAWVPRAHTPLYLRPDEYHQSFNFDLLDAPWDAAGFAEIIGEASADAEAIGAAPTWVLSNHDVMRHTTRYGLPADVEWRKWLANGPSDLLDAERGARRARAAVLLSMALPGSTYIYQGEELGLPEVWDLRDEVLDDPVWTRSGGRERGRDGCRVPIPWTGTGASMGFSTGAADPWLPQPSAYAGLAADGQAGDAASMLELYRSTIRLRRALVPDEPLAVVDLGPDVLAFSRGDGFRCVVNMGTGAVAVPDGEVIHSSGADLSHGLPADAAVWLRLDQS